jgi:mRNA-degrading endonuclease RelE of RelBE toxin-antitoxin system
VKSRTRPSFWRAYESLDPRTREAAKRAYRMLAHDPDHASLRFKKLKAYENLWSVRITEQYRTVGERHGETVTWLWIGTHNEFDKLFG